MKSRGDEMPREAREKKLYSYYKITQTCDKNIVVFRTKKDRMLFLETLTNVKEKYNFKLYGIAIKKSGYECVLYDNGSDITKIMKSLNISFAMKYKCHHEDCKVVFKERYKSEILDPKNVDDMIKKLPLCVYADGQLLDTFLLENPKDGDCIDCFEKATEKLKDLIEAESLTFNDMLKNKNLRNELIKDFRKTSTLNLIEIGQLFGGLSESAICKILSK